MARVRTVQELVNEKELASKVRFRVLLMRSDHEVSSTRDTVRTD